MRPSPGSPRRSEEHTSELQSLRHLVCRLLLPTSTLFPYTTLFRSRRRRRDHDHRHAPQGAVHTRRRCDHHLGRQGDRKSTRLNSSHLGISYAVFYYLLLHSFPTRRSSDLAGAEGIITTDTHPKALSTRVGDATITWVAKGSGMIEPNMATMLAYIFTDAAFDAGALDRMLRAAVDVSFNMLSVDTDTSTSDTCAILANGLAGAVPAREF